MNYDYDAERTRNQRDGIMYVVDVPTGWIARDLEDGRDWDVREIRTRVPSKWVMVPAWQRDEK